MNSFPGRHHDQGDFLNELAQGGNRDNDLFRDNTSNSSGRHNSVPGFSNNQVDPSIEIAFRNMAKNLQDKDKFVAELKLQLDALMTALAIEGNARNDRAVQQFLDSNKMDLDEVAHRIIVRLRTLTEENETLGVSDSNAVW